MMSPENYVHTKKEVDLVPTAKLQFPQSPHSWQTTLTAEISMSSKDGQYLPTKSPGTARLKKAQWATTLGFLI